MRGKRVVLNITQAIDVGKSRVSGRRDHSLCALVAFLDGHRRPVIAVAAPIIVQKLEPDAKTALGPIFSSGLLGAMIGALTFGPLGDRFGRKRMLLIAAVICSASARW